MSACMECIKLVGRVGFARTDLANIVGKFRNSPRPEALAPMVSEAKARLAHEERKLEEHVADEEHDGTPNLSDRKGKVVGIRRRGDGKVPCSLCGTRVSSKSTREHRTPHGGRCPGERRITDKEPVSLSEIPPVVLPRNVPPPVRKPALLTVPAAMPVIRDSRDVPPDGHCQECDKPIPPMRRLCGRCMSRRHA